MRKLIGSYPNGNYRVSIYDDGTKIRENDLDFFEADFPESMDLKITNACDMGCPFCHENSVPGGKHGDILNLPFLDSIHPYTEIAIGGGNPLSHPELIPFLEALRDRNLIANITVNQSHFLENQLLAELSKCGLIHGIGVSLRSGNTDREFAELVPVLQKFPNAVVHVINGVHSTDDLEQLAFRKLKILILGYKEFRRGAAMYAGHAEEIERKKQTLYTAFPAIIENQWFSAVSLDNLAISQLDVKRVIPPEAWNLFFMGDDGRDGAFTSASMYVDAVEMEYARNSCSEERYPVTDNLTEMFHSLKGG